MKCRVILDKTREEEILIYAHQRNELINEIERMCQNDKKQLVGYLRGDIIKLDICDVYCFALQGGRLYAICENERYLIKSRLYNVEEMLDKNFIKINQSSIANINKIKKFEASIGGTLNVIFKNGYSDYVSRRNIKNVKERIGI